MKSCDGLENQVKAKVEVVKEKVKRQKEKVVTGDGNEVEVQSNIHSYDHTIIQSHFGRELGKTVIS